MAVVTGARTNPLERVDRLWRCTGCGYFAHSLPYEDIYEDDVCVGATIHRCPVCREMDWHWCGGDNREKRIGYAKDIARG